MCFSFCLTPSIVGRCNRRNVRQICRQILGLFWLSRKQKTGTDLGLPEFPMCTCKHLPAITARVRFPFPDPRMLSASRRLPMSPKRRHLRKTSPVASLLRTGIIDVSSPLVEVERIKCFVDSLSGTISREDVTEIPKKKRRRTKPRTFRTRMDWQTRLDTLSPKKFRRRHGMCRELFDETLERVRPKLAMSQNHCFSEQEVPPEVSLSIALRFMAGGSHLDIADLHGVDERSVYRHFHRVVDAINETYDISVDVTDDDVVNELEAGFRANSMNQAVEGAIGAVDGLLIRMRCPTAKESSNARRFFCRKKHHALNLQVSMTLKPRF